MGREKVAALSTKEAKALAKAKAAEPAPAPEQAKPKPRPRLKQTNVVSAAPDRAVSLGSGGGGGGEGGGIVLKQWQRLPKQLLQEHCQRNKAPKPEYYSSQRGGEHFCRVRLPDGKDKAKDSHFSAPVGGPSAQDAQHTAALYVLFQEPRRFRDTSRRTHATHTQSQVVASRALRGRPSLCPRCRRRKRAPDGRLSFPSRSHRRCSCTSSCQTSTPTGGRRGKPRRHRRQAGEAAAAAVAAVGAAAAAAAVVAAVAAAAGVEAAAGAAAGAGAVRGRSCSWTRARGRLSSPHSRRCAAAAAVARWRAAGRRQRERLAQSRAQSRAQSLAVAPPAMRRSSASLRRSASATPMPRRRRRQRGRVRRAGGVQPLWSGSA